MGGSKPQNISQLQQVFFFFVDSEDVPRHACQVFIEFLAFSNSDLSAAYSC